MSTSSGMPPFWFWFPTWTIRDARCKKGQMVRWEIRFIRGFINVSHGGLTWHMLPRQQHIGFARRWHSPPSSEWTVNLASQIEQAQRRIESGIGESFCTRIWLFWTLGVPVSRQMNLLCLSCRPHVANLLSVFKTDFSCRDLLISAKDSVDKPWVLISQERASLGNGKAAVPLEDFNFHAKWESKGLNMFGRWILCQDFWRHFATSSSCHFFCLLSFTFVCLSLPMSFLVFVELCFSLVFCNWLVYLVRLMLFSMPLFLGFPFHISLLARQVRLCLKERCTTSTSGRRHAYCPTLLWPQFCVSSVVVFQVSGSLVFSIQCSHHSVWLRCFHTLTACCLRFIDRQGLRWMERAVSRVVEDYLGDEWVDTVRPIPYFAHFLRYCGAGPW